MKIIYSQDYLRKSSTLNYPFTGYYYQLGINNRPNPTWLDSYKGANSKIYPCNTIIKKFNGELRCRISFLIDSEDQKRDDYCVIYILAIDNTKYNDYAELTVADNKVKFSQIAAIILLDNESGFSKYDTNILDMQYVPKCSFTIVNFGNEQVTHYQSEDYDKSNLYQASNDQLIEFNSGNNKLKDLMATQIPIDLGGHMTIRRSGSIQL